MQVLSNLTEICYNEIMIKSYELSDDKTLVKSDQMKNFTEILAPDRKEIGEVSEYFDFPFDFIGGILDDNENARFETDENDNNLILLQYPAQTQYGEIGTFPYSLVWTKDEAVILALNHDLTKNMIFRREYDPKRYKHQLIFQVMYQMNKTFLDYLNDFKHQRRELEKSIKNSTRNDQIVEMINIQSSLIYFEDALENNKEVLQKFIDYLRDEDEDGFADRIYDVFVEIDQAYSETRIQLKILENLRDLFSNIVSNNLNNVMKIMTSITFVLGIPTLITGFYGMNVPIPAQNIHWIVWGIILLMIALCGLVIHLLRRRDML